MARYRFVITECTEEHRVCNAPDYEAVCGKFVNGRLAGLVCTRIKGHKGPCIACGGNGHNYEKEPHNQNSHEWIGRDIKTVQCKKCGKTLTMEEYYKLLTHQNEHEKSH